MSNRVTLYVTLEVWRDPKAWHQFVESARERMRESPNREVVIKLGKNGPQLWSGVDHSKR